MARLKKIVLLEFNPRLEIPSREALNPRTRGEYDALMQILEVAGCTWHSGEKPTKDLGYWKGNGSETCVGLEDGRFVTCGNRAVYESFGKDIVLPAAFYRREGITQEDRAAIKRIFQGTKQREFR